MSSLENRNNRRSRRGLSEEQLEDVLERFRDHLQKSDVLDTEKPHGGVKKKSFDGHSITDLGFLYDSCPCVSRDAMFKWLRVSQFSERVRSLKRAGVWITEKHVLQIMKDITDEDFARKGKLSRFQKYDYRRAINSLTRSVAADTPKVLQFPNNSDEEN